MTPSLTPPSFWKPNFMKITFFLFPTQTCTNAKTVSTINVTYTSIQMNSTKNIAFFSVNYIINSGVQPRVTDLTVELSTWHRRGNWWVFKSLPWKASGHQGWDEGQIDEYEQSTSTCNTCEYDYEYFIITRVRVRVRVAVDAYEYVYEY